MSSLILKHFSKENKYKFPNLYFVLPDFFLFRFSKLKIKKIPHFLFISKMKDQLVPNYYCSVFLNLIQHQTPFFLKEIPNQSFAYFDFNIAFLFFYCQNSKYSFLIDDIYSYLNADFRSFSFFKKSYAFYLKQFSYISSDNFDFYKDLKNSSFYLNTDMMPLVFHLNFRCFFTLKKDGSLTNNNGLLDPLNIHDIALKSNFF